MADPAHQMTAANVTLVDMVNEENPWPGLYQYTEKTREFFHGRNTEVDTLLGMVRRRLLTVFYGQSGLGKSSLVQAGLFPKLRAEFFVPVYIRLGHDALERSLQDLSLIEQTKRNVGAAIDLALQAGTVVVTEGIDPHPAKEETLWMFLHRRELGLRTPEGNPASPVLVFDQFEEIFTIGRDSKAGRENFLRDLADCVENRPPEEVLRSMYADVPGVRPGKKVNLGAVEFQRQDYRIIISLREDYLAELFDLSPMMPSLTENQMRLLPLDGWQALEAVSIPGEKLVDPLVAREIIELVASRRRDSAEADSSQTHFMDEDEEEADPASLKVDPSLLNMVCRELNLERQRRDESKISKQIVGDLLKADRSILRDFYEQCLKELPSSEAVRVFVEEHLLTSEGYRGVVDETKAINVLSKAGAKSPGEIIDALVNKRLLRTFKRVDEKTTWLELTHDVLCETVKTSRTERRAREESEAREAEQRHRLAAEMDREKRMRAEAEEREKLAQERITTMRRERRQTRALLGLVIAMIVVLLFAGVLFKNTWETGKQAKRNSEALAQRAQEEQKADPLLGDVNSLPFYSIALSLDRQNEKLATEAARLLLSKNWCVPVTAPFAFKPRNQKAPLVSASFTPDGESIVAISRGGKIFLTQGPEFDEVVSKQIIGEPGEEVTVTGANFSRDGRRLLLAPYSLSASVRADPTLATLQLWEWSDATQRYEDSALTIAYSGTMRTASWSDDAKFLTVSPSQLDQPSVVLIRKEKGYEVLHSVDSTWIEVSRDGTHVVIAGPDGVARIIETATLQPTVHSKAEFTALRSPAESRIFGIGFSADRTKIWVTSSREPMRLYRLPEATVMEILAERKSYPIRLAHLSGVDRFVVGVTNAALFCDGDLNQWRPMPVDGGYVTPIANPVKPELLTISGASWLGTDTLQVWDLRDLPLEPQVNNVICSGEAPIWFIKLLETIAGGRINIYAIEKPMRMSEISKKYKHEKKSGAYQMVWERFFGSE